jgi:hypothetical protein
VYNRFQSKVYNFLGFIFPEKGFWPGAAALSNADIPSQSVQWIPQQSVQLFWVLFFLGKWSWPGAVALSNGDIPSHSVQLIPVQTVQLCNKGDWFVDFCAFKK